MMVPTSGSWLTTATEGRVHRWTDLELTISHAYHACLHLDRGLNRRLSLRFRKKLDQMMINQNVKSWWNHWLVIGSVGGLELGCQQVKAARPSNPSSTNNRQV